MISLDEARALLLKDVLPLGVEQVAIDRCDRRVLGSDLIAPLDQPAEPRSAMDGYAVRREDAVIGASLRIVGEAFAGAPFAGVFEGHSAVRIATGGVVPAGADTVVMQELCRAEGGLVTIVEPPSAARFIRQAGGDFDRGDRLLGAGLTLGSAQLALAAAAGFATLSVRQRPRVAIFASGDELREPGEPLRTGETYNSAGVAIASLVAGWGGVAIRQPTLPDDLATDIKAIEAARTEAEVLLFIGGASVGERDVLRGAVQQLGGILRFERIAVQPGKPSWHARLPDGQLVLGLPGNPASAFVCAHLLLEPLLAALLNRPSMTKLVPARLAGEMPEGSGRECFWRGHVGINAEGQLAVAPDLRSDSSLQRVLANSNALIRRPVGAAPAAEGDAVSLVLTGPFEF